MKTLNFGLALVLAATSLPAFAQQALTTPKGVYQHRQDPQQITVVNNGLAALKLRLDMIEGAKKSIEMEYFIYSIDTAGRLITQALIRKAKQGVKVRVIVDTSLPIFELNKYYAAVLKEAGIEVHYYNEALLIQVVSTQFRSHRKSLIVDSEQAITGGRNIADEYFDLSPEYNFMDTDMHVRGSIVRDMRTSFEEFWTSAITKPAPLVKLPQPEDFAGLTAANMKDPKALHDKDVRLSVSRYKSAVNNFLNGMKKARAFTISTDEDRKHLIDIHTYGASYLEQQVSDTCRDTIYASDFPGMGEKTRVLRGQLAEEAKRAKHEIYIESPYFVIKKQQSDVLQDMLDRGVRINVLTNSLYSTDAFYTQAVFDTRIGLWTRAGVQVWMHSGERDPQHYPAIAEVAHARWGTHSKRGVIDDKTTIVGTFNMDPRSTNINAEMALICRDSVVLADAVRNDIKARMAYGIKLDRNGFNADGQPVRKEAPLSKKVLFWMTLPLANVLDFLL
ncbi:MAG: phospholipase D family protein [Bdellovibrio sp.]|nr:phospholipase D family protein [Bdellovibrio sp.]